MRVDYQALVEIEEYLDLVEGEVIRLRTVLSSIKEQCANNITPPPVLDLKKPSLRDPSTW